MQAEERKRGRQSQNSDWKNDIFMLYFLRLYARLWGQQCITE